MMDRRIVSVGVLLLLVGSLIPAFMAPVAADGHTVLHVCIEGLPLCHANNLQQAIDMAADGQVILVHPGTYVGAVSIHGDMGQKDITIRSTEGPEVTIIDPAGAFSGVSVTAHRGNVTFEGFTIAGTWVAVGILQGLAAAEGTTFFVHDNIVKAPVDTNQHGNSIQVTGDGSVVTSNQVDVTHQLHPDWSASGILSYGASGVRIEGNTVIGASPDTCISIGGGRFNTPVSFDVEVVGNEVSGCNIGALVQAGVVNATLRDNVIHNNTHGVSSKFVDGWQPAGTQVIGNGFTNNSIHVIDEHETVRDLNLRATMGSNSFDRSAIAHTNGTITPATIFSSLQDAVDAAGPGYGVSVRTNTGATFDEDVRIPAGLDDLTITGSVTLNGGVRTAADNTTLGGLTVVGGGSWGDAGNDSPGIWLEGGTSGHRLLMLSLIGDNMTGRGLLFGMDVSSTSVTSVDLTDWLSGIYINPSSGLLFEKITASGNFAGIGSDGMSDVVVLDSTFTDNVEGIGASSVGLGVVVEGSIFEGNSEYGIANYGGESIMATGNYWGAITGPEDIFVDVSISIGGTGINPDRTLELISGAGDRVLGDVDYTPWCLTANCSVNGLHIE